MEELYDTIEQYLRGQLSDSQKEDFERRLNEDAKLREEMEAFRIAREVIEEGIASQLRSDFKVWDSEKPARIISLRRVLAVAASVAILIVAIGFWQVQQNYSNEALAANFYDDTNSTTRAIEGDESVLNEALSAYQDTDYAKAITLLNNIPDTNTYYLDAQFLLAQSAISHVAVKSSHKGSKDTKNNTKSTFNLRETSCFGVFLPAVQDFGRRVWQEKG
jgi:hypothetical protein